MNENKKFFKFRGSFNKNNTIIWIVSKHLPLLEITKEEENIAQRLGTRKSFQYRQSRGYIRELVSEIFEINPQNVPLNALPGKPPELNADLGHLSISHCNDKLLIGWSQKKIGVDIERKDRNFLAKKLAKRFFNSCENEILEKYDNREFNFQVLKTWVIKESLIKWQKGSISIDLIRWSIDKDKKKASHPDLHNKLSVFFKVFENWIISVATEKELIEDDNLFFKILD